MNGSFHEKRKATALDHTVPGNGSSGSSPPVNLPMSLTLGGAASNRVTIPVR